MKKKKKKKRKKKKKKGQLNRLKEKSTNQRLMTSERTKTPFSKDPSTGSLSFAGKSPPQ